MPLRVRWLLQVFEFVDTDLEKLIESPHVFKDDQIKLFMYQMLNGLKFMHRAHVIHRDMKVMMERGSSRSLCAFFRAGQGRGHNRYHPPSSTFGPTLALKYLNISLTWIFLSALCFWADRVRYSGNQRHPYDLYGIRFPNLFNIIELYIQ